MVSEPVAVKTKGVLRGIVKSEPALTCGMLLLVANGK